MLSLMIIFASALACPLGTGAETTLYELKECRKIFAYSGASSAFFYGFSNNTIYSSQVLPSVLTRFVTVDGVIRSVCHDEAFAYALYTSGKETFLLSLNMKNGNCETEKVSGVTNLDNTSFAVANGERFFLCSGRVYAFAVGIKNGTVYNYSADYNIDELFVNGGSAYARLADGRIYKLGGGQMTYCVTLNSGCKYSNAGNGCLFSSRGGTAYLNEKRLGTLEAEAAAISGGVVFNYSNGVLSYSDKSVSSEKPLLIAAAGKTAVLLGSGYSLSYYNADEAVGFQNSSDNSDNTSVLKIPKIRNGVFADVTANLSVSAFKSAYPGVTSVYDADGELVTSGTVKTGFTAACARGSFPVSVRGDVSGNGKVNSSDFNQLGSALASKEQLQGAYFVSADLNADGALDSRDLVLLIRLSKGG